MSKPKPTEIIRHELVLGRVEREMLETVVAGRVFQNIATPTFDIMKDVSGMTVLAGILEATGIIDITGWVAENTWADEIYRATLDGAYASVDAVIAALEGAAAAVNAGIEAGTEAAAALGETIEEGQEFVEDIVTIDWPAKVWFSFKVMTQEGLRKAEEAVPFL